MGIPLKFLLPLLVLITGLVLLSIGTFIQAKNEYSRMQERTSTQSKIIGNRLATRITAEAGMKRLSKNAITALVTPYMADTLDQIEVHNQNLQLMFSRYISSHVNKTIPFNKDIAAKVMRDQFSHIGFLEESKHLEAYFPINLPLEKGSVLPRNTGFIHLVFDVNAAYEETRKNIINTVIINISIIATMVLVFSLLMYLFVFKRLNSLHKATRSMANGNFDVYVSSKGSDELTQVIDTFNNMAAEMNDYKHTMEEKIELALKERTEQTKLLIQQSRLASMGEMIGNIAHQWRQPLNALGLIIQKVQVYAERGKLTPEIIQINVDKSTLLINNMSQTIDDFRDFFKPDKHKEFFLLKDVLFEVMTLLDAGLKDKNITIEIEIDEDNCLLYGFKNEFAQVIINILNNSKDAIEDNHVTEGRIFIYTVSDDETISLNITDNAGGIPENIIDRIFDPYYTTKEEGKGTGIGLYMSKMIIEENMNATMKVKNTLLGAEFSMIFKRDKG